MAKYDISAYIKIPNQRYYVQSLAISGNGGEQVSGSSKLAQRFLAQLLKQSGSMHYLPGEGCNFVSEISGNIKTEYDIYIAFSTAIATITPILTAEETDADDDVERFSTATINNILISSDSVSLTIVIKNKAGQTESVILPILVIN